MRPATVAGLDRSIVERAAEPPLIAAHPRLSGDLQPDVAGQPAATLDQTPRTAPTRRDECTC